MLAVFINYQLPFFLYKEADTPNLEKNKLSGEQLAHKSMCCWLPYLGIEI